MSPGVEYLELSSNMINYKIVLSVCCAAILAVSGCSRQQSDWQKTRETNTSEAYEQFLKKYPSGEFTAQAQARVKDLYEERDWQKARDTDTPEAYQAFLKQYPEGKWTEEARIRVENFTLAQAPSGAAASPGNADASAAPATAAVAPTANTGSDAAAVAPPASLPKGPPPSSARALPPASDTAPTPAPVAATKTAKAPAKAESGSYAVQLGAFKSGASAAHERWAHLQKEYPALLAGLSSKVVAKKTSGEKLYRLQATGLTEKRARLVCARLKAKSQACVVVVPPAHG
jgi:cell division protein FtsN